MSKNIYQFKVKDIRGHERSLSEFKGKVLLIVNTASKCGFTPQYGELESLYQEFRDRGFEVLAFPSNQFQGQEPLEGEQIEEFCSINYGVSFTVFDKIDVKGPTADPLFQYLSDKRKNGAVSSTPKWNFHKYLVDADGRVVDYFYTLTKPNSGKIRKKITKLLERAYSDN